MGTSFVGRQTELALLESICSNAIAEETPSAVLISGPPGSGKSRLLTEFSSRQRGLRPLRMAGYEAGNRVPLAAAADLMRELSKVSEAGAMLSELLFEPAPAKHSSLEPLRIFEAARRALLGFADPLLLVVDDVQWIDELSVALCAYLVRTAVTEQTEFIVIAAGRPSHETIVFWDSLIKELGTERVTSIELGPLEREDAVQLVRQVAPDSSPERAAELWSRAKGSPFWIGVLARGDERVNLAGLGSDASRVLALLAVTTRPLAVSECAGVLGWDDSRSERAVAELGRSGLVVRHALSHGVAHDLIREAVISELSAPGRRELHAALARWFEHHAETDVHLLHEALIHRREAGADLTAVALRVLQSPRRRLLGRGGLHELAQVADSERLAEPVGVALRIAVAQLASELGDQQIALERWSHLASVVMDPTVRATASLAASKAAMRVVERKEEAFPLLELARSQSTDDPVIAVEIQSHRANLLQVVKHEAEEGRRVAFRAAEKARQLWGQPPIEMTERERDAYVAALQVAFDAAVVEEDGPAQLSIADELTHVARGSEEGVVWADHDRAVGLMFAGRLGEAIDSGRRAWTRAHERMLPMLMLTSGANLLSMLVDGARLDEAGELISECMELEQRVAGTAERLAMGKVGNYSIHDLRHQAWLSRGDWNDAVASLEHEIARQQEPHFRMHLHWHVSVWLARCGDRKREDEIDSHIAASHKDAVAADCRRCARELMLKTAEAFARLGRFAEAERQLSQWDESGRSAAVNDTLWRRHVAALIVNAKSDPSGVVELESVLAQRSQLGLIASALWTRLDLATAVQATNSRRAAEEFRQAGELAAAVGASTEQQMAELGLRRLGVRTWRRGPASHGERSLERLSERERQIASLIAAGQSNPEIASRLFLSRKTVERHVSNILARTGSRNRTELARFLSAQELSSRPTK